MSFSQGLQNVLEKIEESKSQNNSIQSDEYKKYLMAMNDGSKYKCRVLVEQIDFVSFEEYNYVPVNFIKKDGTTKPGNMSYFATGDENDEIGGRVLLMNGSYSAVRPRKVLVVPVLVAQEKLVDKNASKSAPITINETKLIVLPPGKSSAVWKALLECADETGSLTDKYIQFQRSGKGKDTAWTITPLSVSPFLEKDLAEDMNPERVQEIIKGCGRWQQPKETQYVKLRGEQNSSSLETDEILEEDEISSQL